MIRYGHCHLQLFLHTANLIIPIGEKEHFIIKIILLHCGQKTFHKEQNDN